MNYNDIVQKIKSYSISSIINNYTKLSNAGGGKKKGLCPFHKEKTPSFYTDDINGFFKCFGCGESGDVISFIEKIKNYPFNDAVSHLCSIFNIEQPSVRSNDDYLTTKKDHLYRANKVFMDYCIKLISHQSNRKILDYITKERQMTSESLEAFGIGYIDTDVKAFIDYCKSQNVGIDNLVNLGIVNITHKNGYDLFFKDRVIFPISHNDKVLGFGGRVIAKGKVPKYLNSKESIVFKKKEIIYNISRAKKFLQKNKHLIVVEGYMDVIALDKIGVKTAIAPLGTSLTDEQIGIIFKYDDNPIFFFDSDTAGLNATIKAANIATKFIKTNTYPSFIFIDNAKDIDELVSKYSKKDVLRLMKENLHEVQDFIWLTYSKKYDTKNPNQKRILEETLEQFTSNIKDVKLANHYRRFFKDKLFEISFIKKNQNQNKDIIMLKKPQNISVYEENIIDFISSHKQLAQENSVIENLLSRFSEDNINRLINIINDTNAIENKTSSEDDKRDKQDINLTLKFTLENLILDWELALLENNKKCYNFLLFKKEKKKILEKKKDLIHKRINSE